MHQMEERTNELQRKSSAIKEREKAKQKAGKMTEREKMIKKEMEKEND